jgi:general secretion pathway protein K
VTALPARTAINVNTAPPEVLRSIAEVISASGAEDLVDRRDTDGFEDVEDFLQSPALAGAATTVTADGLSVASTYFLLHAEARIGRARARLTSLLRRGGGVAVVARSRGEL